jgi:integrase
VANVSGTVQLVKRKRGDKWYARYRVNGEQKMQLLGPAWTEKGGRPPDGYYTRKTARAALDGLLTDARRGEIPTPGKSGRTFGDAVAEWLRYVEHEKARRGSTVRDYRNTAESALEPEFGKETPLETAERIDQYRLRLLSEGELSRRTIQKRMVVLGSVLKRAVRLKWIQHNPLEEVERVNVPSTSEFNVLSPVQVEAVARKATSDLFKAAIIVGAYTGLRAGEVCALRWRDIDFAGMSLRVSRSIPVGGELGPPKSGHARSVPLMDEAAAELDRLSLRGWETEADSFVFLRRSRPATRRGPATQGPLRRVESSEDRPQGIPGKAGVHVARPPPYVRDPRGSGLAAP